MVHAFRAVFGAYALACLLVVLWPTPVDRPAARQLDAVIALAQRVGFEVVTYARIEVAANVVMFALLAAFAVLALPRLRWWIVPVLCAGLSGSIELVQFLFIEARFASVMDVAANGIGGALGTAVAIVGRRGIGGPGAPAAASIDTAARPADTAPADTAPADTRPAETAPAAPGPIHPRPAETESGRPVTTQICAPVLAFGALLAAVTRRRLDRARRCALCGRQTGTPVATYGSYRFCSTSHAGEWHQYSVM
ncbi:VanZ family protein [Marisediminicola senii]|uniref:VanZ family protein n=1 Tax=Marisediminicola senii TaxID=2711233 RepID=UPI0013ECEA46|nr:VanZ family protein [Marisediminicola senii]